MSERGISIRPFYVLSNDRTQESYDKIFRTFTQLFGIRWSKKLKLFCDFEMALLNQCELFSGTKPCYFHYIKMIEDRKKNLEKESAS